MNETKRKIWHDNEDMPFAKEKILAFNEYGDARINYAINMALYWPKVITWAYISDLHDFIHSIEDTDNHLSSDLEEVARKAGQKYFPDECNIWARPNYEAVKAECAFKEGAKWQEEQFKKNIKEE